MIPYGRQWINDDDIDAVIEVLRSDWLTQGPSIAAFEASVASRVGAKHAVAVSSGTAALHLAVLAAGVGPGDVVWTSPITFVASANCALYAGASVGFVDIEPDTALIDAEQLEFKLAVAAETGVLPKAIVVVHLAGQPCDMARIGAAASRYGVAVIEDAAHAIGGSYAGAPVGACEYSDMTTFSFHPVKVVTTGEGGMITTNDDLLAEKLRLGRTHGITRDPSLMTREPDGPWYYEQVSLGYNYRITDFQCALGISQMRRLDEFLARRAELATRYDEMLVDLPVSPLVQRDGRTSGWHLYVINLQPGTHRSRREVFDALRAAGIGVNVHYIPVHLQPYYRALGFEVGDFPVAEAYYDSAITLPLYPAMSEADQDAVVAALREALS
ncbi:MAG TPA: UDP-4-amino-4,6-dideoxy-N-acetyl-beta-L-altrosamine transaminase [Coriobacteriia bacterium]